MQSPGFKDQVFGANRTTSGLRNLKFNEFAAAGIPVPPLAEQRRIVERIKELLERADEIRTLREEAIKEAEAVFPSVLSASFDAVAGEVRKVAIDEVLIESRYGTSKKCLGAKEDLPILRIPNINDGLVDFNNLKYCSVSPKEAKGLILQDGDLLVVRTNGSPKLVGRCAVYRRGERDFGYASYLIRLRVNTAVVNPQYLGFFLESTAGRDCIAAIRRTSAGQYNVNSENLRGIKIPLIARQMQDELVERMLEQRRIARELRNDLRSRVTEREALAQSILRKAFAGEL